LAVLERGLRVVYIPQAELYHFESKTRSPEVRADEMAAIHEIWEKQFRWDPYYSPNLATDSNDFKIAPVPLHQLNLQARLTPIEEKTARTVNQPIDREKWAATRQSFSRKYLAGDGIEIGALHQPLWTPPSAHVRYVDRFDGAGLREHYPELKDFKLVNVDVLDDGEKLTTFTDASLDFIISNHMLEHCENPIGTIRNHLSKVRRGGILYYAVPDKRKTFDIERELTPFDHLVEDDRLGPERSRRKHFLEWSQWVNHQSGTKIEEEANRLMRQNYSIHYHVWDDAAFREFVESTREYLDDPFAIEELVENEFETIAILRKR
jgi:SAM-dependent methyltransferase